MRGCQREDWSANSDHFPGVGKMVLSLWSFWRDLYLHVWLLVLLTLPLVCCDSEVVVAVPCEPVLLNERIEKPLEPCVDIERVDESFAYSDDVDVRE